MLEGIDEGSMKGSMKGRWRIDEGSMKDRWRDQWRVDEGSMNQIEKANKERKQKKTKEATLCKKLRQLPIARPRRLLCYNDIYIYVYTCAWICVYIYIFVMYACMYVCRFVCVCLFVCAWCWTNGFIFDALRGLNRALLAPLRAADRKKLPRETDLDKTRNDTATNCRTPTGQKSFARLLPFRTVPLDARIHHCTHPLPHKGIHRKFEYFPNRGLRHNRVLMEVQRGDYTETHTHTQSVAGQGGPRARRPRLLFLSFSFGFFHQSQQSVLFLVRQTIATVNIRIWRSEAPPT